MRPPEYQSFKQVVTYHLCLYYLMRQRNPGIKIDIKKHEREVAAIDHRFQRTLQKRKYEEWNTEDNRGQFRAEVKFLTGK